jgi:TonB-linked SusC/RagA family outer membrane protein
MKNGIKTRPRVYGIFMLLFFLAIAGLPANGAGEEFQQTLIPVSGTVTDQQKQPLPGVSIAVKGTSVGTITDANGAFSLVNVPENATLVFSFVGMKTREIAVAGKTTIRVALEEDIVGLDEVVAVGYGTMKRSSLTGSTAVMDAGKIEAFPSVNIADAFQGKTAGVYVNPSNEPGGDVAIRVRGNRSLSATNDPLIIIDDVPGDLSNLNSTDIESVEVLKDAAATAIYGSRAANGVILITTKKAKITGMTVEVNSYAGINRFSFIEMQSKDEYVDFIRNIICARNYGYTDADAWKNSDITTQDALEAWSSGAAANYAAGREFDWQSMMLDDASLQTGHHISVSTKNQRASSRLSYNYMYDNGYYATNDFQKHILSYYYNYQVNDWLKFGFDSRLAFRKNNLAPDDLWEFMKRMNPLENPYNEDGSLRETLGLEQYTNPLWTYEDGYFIDKKSNRSADIVLKADVKLTGKLTYNTNFKMGFGNGNRSWYYHSLSMPQLGGNPEAGIRNTETYDHTWNNILNYVNDFGRHHLNITAVQELQFDKTVYSEMSGENVPLKELEYYNLETATDNLSLDSDYSKSTLASFLGRVQYEYNGRYLFNFALRADGSSRLAEGNKWAYFPSAAAAWRISEEPFMQKMSWLAGLKLRASYGEVGNQGIDPYQTQTLLESGTYSWGDTGTLTWAPETLANKGLGWEISKTMNLGFDWGIWNNRVSGMVDFYKTKNRDLLMQRTLAGITGFGSIWDNIGSTENKGFELVVNSDLIRSDGLNWNLNVNLSRNWNKITSLPNGDDPSNEWFIGQPINVCYDYRYEGIWQISELDEAQKYGRTPGEVKVWDNGDYDINESDKVILGQRDPKWMASLISDFRWDRFDLSMVVNAMWGHLIEIKQFGNAEYNGEKWLISAMSDMWTPLNTGAYYPRPQQSAQSNNEASACSYMKGDHLKMQNISLGYTFNNLIPGIQKARLYVEAKNAFYLYRKCAHDRDGANHVQPEVVVANFAEKDDGTLDDKSFNKTLPATFVVGINLTF